MTKVIFFFTLMVFLFAQVAWSADISGTWAVTMKGPQDRDEVFDLVIEAAGEDLTVTTGNHPALKNLVGSGTVKGDDVVIRIKTIDDHDIEFFFEGKVEGKKMTGVRELILGPPPAGRTLPDDAGSPTGSAGASADEASSAGSKTTGEISDTFTAEKK